jgi:hypothetical protein
MKRIFALYLSELLPVKKIGKVGLEPTTSHFVGDVVPSAFAANLELSNICNFFFLLLHL